MALHSCGSQVNEGRIEFVKSATLPSPPLPPSPRTRSLPAVEDIRDCLQNTSLHRRFVAAFRKSLTDRLLRPGEWGLNVDGRLRVG